ncbi:hypothetical protein GCM10027456_14600 [Kineosporia babensis]
MGVVHLGLDANGKAVAVKVLRPHVAGDPDARRRLAREVATLRRVRHPRVAGVLDADVESDVPYIVTSFVPGKTLEKHVRDHGPLPRGHVARIGKVMADALRTVHSAGVVHRDVKPANVMLLDGEPVLIDFGIAHAADESRITHTGLVMGTPGYLSPEIIGGDPVSAATDWWGWGATLAYAATGRPPFGTGPIEVVLDRVRRGATDLDGVDEGLRATLTSALSVDPRTRPTPEALIAGLAAPAPARPTTGPQPQIPAWGTSGVYVSPDEETVRTPGPGEEIRKQVKPTDSTEIRIPGPDEMATMRTPPPSFADAQTSVIPPTGGGSNDPTSVLPPSGRGNARTSVIQPNATGGNNDPTSVIPPYHQGGGSNAATSVIPPADGPKATRRFDHPGQNGPNQPNQQQNQGPGHGYQHQPQNGFENRPGQRGPVLAKGRPIGDDPDHPQEHYDHDEHRESVLDRLPLGSMPLFLVGLLAALAGMAAVAPYGAVLVAAVGMVAARVVDRTNTALLMRRDVHGPRASDGMVTVLSMPWRILGAVMSTVFSMILPLLIGVSVAFIAAAAQSGGTPSAAIPGAPIPLAAGMVALVLTGWWGPGGGPVRRGTEKAVASITSNAQIRLVAWAVLVLLLLSCFMILRNPDHDPDWGPLKGSRLVNQLTT